MNISFSTPIINLRTSNGYGHAALYVVDSLKQLGHNVPFQDGKAPVQLNFSQPEFYKLHKDQYQISYTPWESTLIPEKWRYYMQACDEIWTTSDWCANIFEDNGFKNVKVYPHGIDPMWIPKKRISNGKIKFLHLGEPAQRKAGQMVVDAFIELFGNNKNYSLTIKADKQNTTRIYNKEKDGQIVGLPSEHYSNIQIITKEMTDAELVGLYQSHHVMVYPSYGEGFGFIPFQSLATGMPTICTSGWAHYEKYLGPLSIKSKMIDTPWPFPHPGKVLEPNYKHLLELMKNVAENFNAYSGYYYTQSTKIHQDYKWIELTKNAFDPIIKKFL